MIEVCNSLANYNNAILKKKNAQKTLLMLKECTYNSQYTSQLQLKSWPPESHIPNFIETTQEIDIIIHAGDRIEIRLKNYFTLINTALKVPGS